MEGINVENIFQLLPSSLVSLDLSLIISWIFRILADEARSSGTLVK